VRSMHLVLAGLMAARAAIAADYSLLPNGDFSQQSQLNGWSCQGGTWNSDDAASAAGSGSMALQNAGGIPGQCTSACIPIRPGVAYTISGQSRVLLGNPVISFACAQAGTDHCNSFTYDIQGPAMSAAYAWNNQAATASGILTGLSLMCTITLTSADLGSVSAHFDNLFLTTDVIFFGGFEP